MEESTSNTKPKIISYIFVIAGLYNFSILIFSKFFTNPLLEKYDNLFNFNGTIGILLWGMAYISIYKSYNKVPILNIVFFIEKMYYVYSWIMWLNKESIDKVFQEDFLTGLFYAVYGIGDLFFGLFFLYNGLKSGFKENQNNDITLKEE
jgi:hypothetical protein